MTKQDIQKVLGEFKKLGITTYSINCEDAKSYLHDNSSAFIAYGDDVLYSIAITKNPNRESGDFEIITIPYDRVTDVAVYNIPFTDVLKFVEQVELKSDEFTKFLQNVPKPSMLNRDTLGGKEQAIMGTNEKGETVPVIPPGSAGYVVS